jgi:hypothetical protein
MVIHCVINRYRTRIGGPNDYARTPGDLIETVEWGADAPPLVGDLITVHPCGPPDDHSWTGRVTGRQHVFSAYNAPRLVLTVCDERKTQ